MAITITVTYGSTIGATNPTVPFGTNTINWAVGTGVTSITSIAGLPSPPFTVTNNNGWSATDANSTSATTTYPYTLYIWDGKTTHAHDPQITNEPQ